MKKMMLVLFVMSFFFVSGQHVYVKNYMSNCVFVGFDNSLEIVANNCDSLLLTSENGNIQYKTGCKFNFRPLESGNVKVNIWMKKETDTTYISSVYFKALFYTDFKATISGVYNGEIDKNELLVAKKIVALSNSYDINLSCDVLSYDVLALRKDTVMFFEKINGMIITQNLKTKIQRLSSNDQLHFFNINIKSYYGDEILVNPIDLIIR